MTTVVKVEAHCPKHIEVKVAITGIPEVINEYTLQDGEKAEYLVYENREVHVKEVPKK